jgi:hypothetical protein
MVYNYKNNSIEVSLSIVIIANKMIQLRFKEIIAHIFNCYYYPFMNR